ncbi:hypothetical protein Emag_005529 [Eimeria magna]
MLATRYTGPCLASLSEHPGAEATDAEELIYPLWGSSFFVSGIQNSSSSESRMSPDTSSGAPEYVASERDAVLSAFTPQDLIQRGARSASGSSPQLRQAASSGQRRAPLLKTLGAVLLSVMLAVLLMHSLCHSSFRRSLPGSEVRRLGESGSEEDLDVPRPDSPDFTELCHALGEWSPDSPLPGERRASLDLVEAILAGVEEEEESGNEAALSPPPVLTFYSDPRILVSGAGLKRSRGEDDWDEAESPDPSPSSKIARMHSPTGVEQTSLQSLHPGDGETKTGQMSSVHPPTGSASDVPQDIGLLTSHRPTASSSTVPALDEGASTSSGASELAVTLVPEGHSPQAHPFVRLPPLQPGVESPQLSLELIKQADFAPHKHCFILRTMRELFLKPELDRTDALTLVCLAQDLARYAYAGLSRDVSGLKPNRAAEYLARRFMVVWSLYAAAQTLHHDWPNLPWWQAIADNVSTRYSPLEKRRTLKPESNNCLVLDLINALEKLKSGIPVPEDVVIDLKRRIFCSPDSPSRFKTAWWDPWRDDDREYSR